MLTVVFATHNRAPVLPRVLEAFSRLGAPDGGWRLIVVDNGSTDATSSVVQEFSERLPLTVLHCAAPGKNRALNIALEHLQGDLVVFTDDDVLPDPDWLQRLREAVDAHPEATMFGGTVLPDWPGPVPDWLTEQAVDFTVLFAKNARPSGECRFIDIFGPNMAIRRSVFDGGMRFAEHVGPDATRPLYAMGSETELLRRLEADGHRAWFEANARVRHIIRPEQLDEAWILERAFRFGIGEGRNYVGSVTPSFLLRAAVCRVAARAVAPLSPSPWRTRIRYRDRWLAGVLAARGISSGSSP